MRYEIYDSDINSFVAKHNDHVNAPNFQDVKENIKSGAGTLKKIAGSLIGLIMVLVVGTIIFFASVLTFLGLFTLDRLGKVKIVLLFLMLIVFMFMSGKYMIMML